MTARRNPKPMNHEMIQDIAFIIFGVVGTLILPVFQLVGREGRGPSGRRRETER